MGRLKHIISHSRHNRWIFTVLIGAAVGLSWAAWRAPAAHAEEGGGRLLGVRAALRGGWLRVVFDFSKPVPYRVRVRPWGVQVGRLTLEFSGVSKLDVPKRIALAGRDGVILKLERAKGSRVLARLPLPRSEGPYDHFTLKNPDRVILDLAIRRMATAKLPDFRTGPILMSPYRLVQRPGPKGWAVRTANAERPASPVYLAQASMVVISPPLEAERFSLIGRKAPPPVIPKAPAVIPAAAPQLVKVKRTLFGKPIIPKPRHGEEGAQEYLEALKHYHEGNSTEASESFDRFARKFSGSRLAPSAAYLSGDSHFEAKPSVDESDLELDDPGASIGQLKRDRKQKRLRQAVTAYRWAVQAFPETEWTPWGLLQLGRSQSQLGLYFRAETTFQDLNDRYPKHPLTAVGMAYQGFTNLKLGDSELALEIFQHALKHPRAGAHALALARYGMGGAYFQLKKIKLAKAEFEKALKKAPALANFSPDILFLMGETFLASGEFSRARKFYVKQMERFPDSENLPYVMTRVAESHFLEKDLARAVDRYAEVIEKHPRTESSIISLIRLADLAVEEPDVTKKLKSKHPALRDPLKTYRRIGKEGKPRALAELAWSRLGGALMSRKRFGEAVEVFRTLVEDYADGRLYGRALFGLESALIGQIDEHYGRKQYVDVLHLFHPEQDRGLKGLIKVRPLIQVAGSYQKLGLFEKANGVLRRVDVSSVSPGEREELHILRIEGLTAQGRREELEAALKGYLRKYPQGRIRVIAARSLADVLVWGERWDEAERFLKKAVLEVDRGVERARMESLLARVYTHGERYAMAVDSLQRALRMTRKVKPASPFLADTYYLLGETLMYLGQFTEAAAILKEGASRFPDDALRGWALYEAGSALWQVGEAKGAAKTLDTLTSGKAPGFWRRMARAMKEDMNWWQKHKQLKN